MAATSTSVTSSLSAKAFYHMVSTSLYSVMACAQKLHRVAVAAIAVATAATVDFAKAVTQSVKFTWHSGKALSNFAEVD